MFNRKVWPDLYPKIHSIGSICFLFLVPVILCTVFYLSLSCVVCVKKQKDMRADNNSPLKTYSRSRSGTSTKTSSNTKVLVIRSPPLWTAAKRFSLFSFLPVSTEAGLHAATDVTLIMQQLFPITVRLITEDIGVLGQSKSNIPLRSAVELADYIIRTWYPLLPVFGFFGASWSLNHRSLIRHSVTRIFLSRSQATLLHK